MTADRSSRSSAPWLVAAVIVLAIVAGILAFVLLGSDGGTPSASASPQGTPEATPSPTFNAELLEGRLTVLVIGLDLNAEREAGGASLNTDTLMLASVSGDGSEVTLISLPRDSVDIPLPDGTLYERKVNGIYAERGVEALVGAMETLFDVPIDGYALIDMDDLVALVDAVGGVTVDPETRLVDPIVDLDISPGAQEVDGETALAYVRTRVDTDYGRAARQQEVLLEIVRGLVAPETDIDVRSLLDGLDSLETDLPLDELPTLLEIARRAADAEVTRQVLEPPEFISFEGDAGDGRGYILIPDVEAIRDLAARTIRE